LIYQEVVERVERYSFEVYSWAMEDCGDGQYLWSLCF